jgi:hypothetical protein
VHSWDISVGIATRLRDRRRKIWSSVSSRVKSSLSSLQRPDRLWGPTDLLTNEYHVFFSRRYSKRVMNLTYYLHLMPSLSTPNVFMARCLYMHRDNFAFTFMFVLYVMYKFVRQSCIGEVDI